MINQFAVPVFHSAHYYLSERHALASMNVATSDSTFVKTVTGWYRFDFTLYSYTFK